MFPSMLLILLKDLNFIPLLFLLFLFNIFFKYSNPSSKVYLIDFACYKPKESQKVTRKKAIEKLTRKGNNLTQENIQFLWKAIMASGIGDCTYAPESMLKDPPDVSLKGARREIEGNLYGAVDALLAKTRVQAKDIGVLIVCCSVFNPVPSLTTMIVNRYKLRHDIKSFNLSGMGCSAGMAAIGLANNLLQANEDVYAMVVSSEMAQSTYSGNDANKQIIACVFRAGASAILLSNRRSDRHSSNYQLIHAIRSNTASSDTSYRCIFEEEDSEGLVGVTVNKSLLVEARKAITLHITSLGRLLLPVSDQVLFGLNYLIRKLHITRPKPYTPDFRRAVDHFFPHVGGSVVLDEVKRNLKLDVEAPRMTLYRFGNLSSSTVWYELAYAEAKRRIKKGDRVWQIAFGAGFKCNSVIWHAMKSIDQEKTNPWFDEIEKFPVEQPNAGQLPPLFVETTG